MGAGTRQKPNDKQKSQLQRRENGTLVRLLTGDMKVNAHPASKLFGLKKAATSIVKISWARMGAGTRLKPNDKQKSQLQRRENGTLVYACLLEI